LIILAILLLSSLIVIYFSKRISSPIVTLAEEVKKIRDLELESEVRVKSNIKEIFLMDNAIAAMRIALRSFARYVPKKIVKDLIGIGEEIAIGGEKKEITILFSDISGFTTIAESCPIDLLIQLLGEYFDTMSKIILESQGTIDKFTGDGIMAFWGAPISLPNHALRACTAALLCSALLVKFNEDRRKKGLPEFPTRFGINTGTVIVGNIGTSDRINYTVIGDAVNTTARLQEIDKIYHTTIILSEDTYAEVKEEFVVRPLDVIAVKGKKEKIKIFELVAKKGGEKEILATPEQIELCHSFNEGFEAFQRKDFKLALSFFQEIQRKYPEDFPTKIYLDRISEAKE
jgi:adenylate cyclase